MHGEDNINIFQEYTCLGLRTDKRPDWNLKYKMYVKAFQETECIEKNEIPAIKVLEEIYYETIIARTTYYISVRENCSEATFDMLDRFSKLMTKIRVKLLFAL